MLKLNKLNAYYGEVQILFDVNLNAGEGEMTALVGANGAGKSTTVSAVSGLVDRVTGTIEFIGEMIQALSPHQVVERGLIHVPERRRLFPFLTVMENLEMGAFTPRARKKREETLSQVFEHLPVLEDRQDQMAGTLSGGEQQMCAIGRGLMARPHLLMLDEPTEGLAPIYVERIFEIVESLKEDGKTILMIEQNVTHTLKMADQGYVLENGRVVLSGKGSDLRRTTVFKGLTLESNNNNDQERKMTTIEAVHPKPDEEEFMPYAPAIQVSGQADVLYISGATASPLYHKHPHVPEEHVLPDDIKEQTRMAMESIKMVLDLKGITWRNVVKVTKYLTDIREADEMHKVMGGYFGDWKPASTLLSINNLSSPGARVEWDMIAVVPKGE